MGAQHQRGEVPATTYTIHQGNGEEEAEEEEGEGEEWEAVELQSRRALPPPWDAPFAACHTVAAQSESQALTRVVPTSLGASRVLTTLRCVWALIQPLPVALDAGQAPSGELPLPSPPSSA